MSDQPQRAFSRLRDVVTFSIATLYYHSGLALVGLVLFLPLAGFLPGHGVPYLYWRESAVEQGVVGFVVGLVHWHLGFVAYALAAAKPGAISPTPGDPTEARRYVLHVQVPLLVIAYIGATLSYRFGALGPPRTPAYAGAPFGFGLILSLGFTGLMLRATRSPDLGARLDRWATKVTSHHQRLIDAVDEVLCKLGFAPNLSSRPDGRAERDSPLAGLALEYGRQRVFGLMAMFSGIMLLVWLGLSVGSRAPSFARLPAAVPVCVALGLLGSGFGFARVSSRRLALPVIIAAILFALWQWATFPGATMMRSNCGATDERCHEAWSERPSLAEPRPSPPATTLVDDDDALAAMMGESQDPIVIIATSGGGIRSAGWATAIFARLEQHDPQFFSRVRVITGASGGMVGASHWIASKASDGADPSEIFCRATTNSLYAPIGTLMLATPRRNRGEALEDAWELATPALGDPLHALAEREQEGELPSLVFAPMLVEDGSQMLMSNLDLDWYALADRELVRGDPPNCSGGESLWPSDGGCVNARQFFARVPADTVKLSTIARINASYPYVSPAVSLPFAELPRAVDAGYYDNYGIKLAAAWIARHTFACPSDATCLETTRPILLLELRDHDPDRPIKPNRWIAILQELSSPIEGLFAGRFHVATHRNAAEVDVLRQVLGRRFEHVVLQYDGEAALGWELTGLEREDIWNTAKNDGAWERLGKWWRGHGRPFAAREDLPRPKCLSGG